jgi:hypothetical protein
LVSRIGDNVPTISGEPGGLSHAMSVLPRVRVMVRVRFRVRVGLASGLLLGLGLGLVLVLPIG